MEIEIVGHLTKSILSWAVLGILGFMVVEIKKISKNYGTSQKALKIMLRKDLINRWKIIRKRQFAISTQEQDEWLADYEVYHELNGKNGVLDGAYKKIQELTPTD